MGDRPGAVLVLTNACDVTADVVLRLLADRRVPVVRFDPGADPPGGASLTARYGPGGQQRGTLRTVSRTLDLSEVRSVWVRRPSPYEPPPGMAERDGRFAAAQAFWGTGGILASLPGAHYVNHPWLIRNAEYKPAQLAAASRSGFLVPNTVITENPEEAREFCSRQPGGAVYKPLWDSRYRTARGAARQVWVRGVDPAEITDAVSVCPHLFQAEVPKAFDVRVTAVGDRLFGVRIESPDLDWRRRQDLMSCAPVEVPGPVARSVGAYLAEFRLTFGTFDFAVTADGSWYFLECNANGQWAWQPPGTTAAIAGALADQLEKGADT
ncbi:ATP-grasp ribosomal peptide maturase [Kitasatospora sp. SolWspMP-SS2h]|uniref:ATP-grasp ribosomal peptide maturase n=1 Tax=Kitasatospora sp. SolWspMP-SS2h TaxID=1305729 RepID=UPI000DB985FC|nr:ATP-grasp ribosomal peptide maturase [Kitasatospora sp. SolWspMP-SS2h]RAJ40455.1 ATP-grasp ribosomal peptide maturase [Kitasatospora sp. SolWspMP-SS2h]